MVVVYSPHREGGTLHFPSPSQRASPASALEQLRRSLSRSPSKGPAFRLITSKSSSSSPNSPLSPSPRSPANRPEAFAIVAGSRAADGSPLTTLFPASAKKRRPVLRHLSPMRASPRSLSAQRSPARRVLTDSSDNGNSGPQSSMGSSPGDENHGASQQALEDRKDKQPFGDFAISPDESLLAPHHAFSRKEKQGGYFDVAPKSSPLKRSDASANFDLSQVGSPSAKRRSLHGASFGPDFNIFDQAALFEQSGPGSSVLDSNQPQTVRDSLNPFSTIPRRSSSLRKTTLQQRYDASPAARRPTADNLWDGNSPAAPAPKARNRLSLEFPIPQASRQSPFFIDSLPSASASPAPQAQREGTGLGLGNLALPQRHPLSRTITQSSSGSELAVDSPTHVPLRNPESRRPRPEFSRSLPLGALRPAQAEPAPREFSRESSFATPENYKLAKPLPAAFMSTGLISKRNKNFDYEQLDLNDSVGNMPDTPCKRPSSMAAVPPALTPNINLHKSRQARHTLHSFGTPSTPFNPHVAKPVVNSGKGLSIFGSDFNKVSSRRGSFLGSDVDSPPTPTKQASGNESLHPGEFNSTQALRSPQPLVKDELVDSPRVSVNCKSISISTPRVERASEINNDGESSPPAMRFGRAGSIPSFSKRPRASATERAHRPTPLPKASPSLPLVAKRAKRDSVSAASPVFERHLRNPPRTPLESMVPPDPSGLSISAQGDKGPVSRRASVNECSSLNLPATPTASRDSLGRFPSFGISVTPVHHSVSSDVDLSITSRYDKVEPLNTGEFSQVFRVSRLSDVDFAQERLTAPRTRSSYRASSETNRVWAVKKSKTPYIGPKDRLRKLQEVEVLKALGRSDHTILYIDSWEYHDHLYIQTEYCEEGALDSFLQRAGQNARLDDFRIWKIMLELAKGLKHVHDSGFIHLDLKPANILITFEGVLKIADFGMASSWPAPAGIEGEGDREYIGPEILMGQYDKPADIFAFGLIMLEIAANVMLPDNGASWQRLRSGDMSDVPSLTSSSEISNISRDISGNPIMNARSGPTVLATHNASSFAAFDFGFDSKPEVDAPAQGYRTGELQTPPEFMVNAEHPSALDTIVRWMISPNPADRPVVDDLLATEGVCWTEARRRAGATIFEGNYGPADDILQDDAEMIDA